MRGIERPTEGSTGGSGGRSVRPSPAHGAGVAARDGGDALPWAARPGLDPGDSGEALLVALDRPLHPLDLLLARLLHRKCRPLGIAPGSRSQLREHWLHDRLGRADLQVVEPAREELLLARLSSTTESTGTSSR